jgi:hypothetical protein
MFGSFRSLQQVGSQRRFIGLPRASWAARTMQSSCGGKPQRCQRSHSPQLKSRLRRRLAAVAQLVNILQRMLSVRIILLPGPGWHAGVRLRAGMSGGIDQDQLG